MNLSKALFLLFLPMLFVTGSLADPSPLPGISQTCIKIAHKLSSVKYSECQKRHLSLSGGRSVDNTPILIKEYPPLPSRQPLGRVLLLGGIHGDEYSSVTISFKWMRILDQYHSGLFHWHVVPLVNPDGLLRPHSQRMNEHGVDLNRNFPTPNWEKASSDYWVNRTHRNPRRYPGPEPLSEPESLWLTKEIETFKPDVIVSIHAPYGILDFDGPRKAPTKLGHLYLNLLGTYPGSLGNYAGVVNHIPVITIELPSAGVMPSDSEIDRIWMDLVQWLRTNIKRQPIQADNPTDQTEPS